MRRFGTMKFFIIIGRNALYTYERDGQHFEPQFIERSELFTLNSTNISEEVNSYMETLANEKNLGTIAKLEFEVLEGSEDRFNAAVVNALGEHIDKVYSLKTTLMTVVKKLQRDKKLMIDTYGINYEGHSYKIENNSLSQDDFDLLAYTIHSNDVVSLMDCN